MSAERADTPMRSGLTTGTCAAAAAKAAALVLAGSHADAVEIELPGGERVTLPVESAEKVSADTARAVIVKDAGDDPDITDGSRVEVTVALGGQGVRWAAGEGVGTVTREGLQLAVGEPAINPVPRAMIAEALADVLGSEVGALVTVAIPGGAELAAKTFNPRLGIEGGLSVIGTSGRVEPKSSEAWMRSLLPQVDVVLAAGHRTVWLSPGGLGEEFAIAELAAPEDAVVQCSNFVGELLDYCGRSGVDRVVLVGHAGKLVKVAAGLFDTHSRAGDARLETVAAIAAAEGAAGPLVARLLELATVQAAVAVLADAGLANVWDAVADRAAARSSQRCGVPVDVVLVGYERALLGASKSAPVATQRVASADADGRHDRAGAPSLVVVGVGPGAEELLLPAAWREIRAAEAIAGGARLLDAFAPVGARRIAVGGDVAAALAQVRMALAEGLRTVLLSSGDPGFFGILASVRRELPDVRLTVVPGISSAQLALARLDASWEGVAFASAHGRDPRAALDTCARNGRTLVLTDREATPQALAAALVRLGDFRVTICERLGYPDERVTTGSAADIATGEFAALAVLLVERDERRRTMINPHAPGVPDDAFSRGSTPMSKMEVRAVTVAKARIAPGSRVLDIGAGTGALTVDAALACPSGEVVAVERDEAALVLLRENVERLAPGNVTVVAGEAPDAFAQVRGAFDVALIGGSGGRLADIVAALPSMLVPGGRVVVNTIGLASTTAALEALADAPWTGRECVQLSVSRAETIGRDLRFVPLNPVWVVSASLAEEGEQ